MKQFKSLIIITFFLFVQEALSQGVKDNFDHRLEEIVDEFKYPGAIAAYRFMNGETGIATAGLADRELDIDMKDNHRFLAGSVGKTFVSAVVMILEKEEKLSFEDHISKWFESETWFANLPNHETIKIKHLLNHSSGLLDHVNTSSFVQEVVRRISDPSISSDFVLNPVELISFILDEDPLFPVGQGYSYTDTGYIILGLIIEKIMGESYYSLLEDYILKPFRLDLTTPSNKIQLELLASGYTSASNPFGLPAKISEDQKMTLNPANEWTGGGLISNPLDLATWGTILYSGKLMESDYLDDLLMNHNSSEEDYYGFGVQVGKTNGYITYGHAGWFPGYRTQLIYFPKLELAIAVQINTDQNVNMGATVLALLEVLVED